ncbi:MAG: hypothetical protein AB7D47_13150 [Desulfovibrio sp.]
MCGGSSGIPSVDTSTPVPVQYTDEDQQQARDDAADKARKAAGAAGAIKTSGRGLTSEASTTKKTLLGQ